jgi:hypothetical protein
MLKNQKIVHSNVLDVLHNKKGVKLPFFIFTIYKIIQSITIYIKIDKLWQKDS